MAGEKKDDDHEKLLLLLLAAYMLSPSDMSTMVKAISTGYLISMQAAYREAAKTVDSRDAQDWVPSMEEEQAAQDWAKQQAEGITTTYNDDLKRTVTLFLDSWQKEQGSLQGAQDASSDIIGGWTKSRSEWKAQQISNYSCGSGGAAGTNAFLVDVARGNIIDTETGETVEIGEYGIAVLPGESSSDICKDYAGNVYDISENDTIPDFPIHANCPHEKVIMLLA